MATETVSKRYVDIDDWSTRNAVEAMFEGQLSAVAAVRPALPAIAEAADAAAARLAAGGRLVYAGAGTSGRIAVQDGVELGPTFGWPADRLAYALAGGFGALSKSAELAEDDGDAARRDLDDIAMRESDVLVGVAASGRTPYTVAAVERANAVGALTIGVSNNGGAPLLAAAQIGICAETGSEVIAGSTRMKAGTAQKAILNILSTAIMIRCGRVYKGLMVDMVISNEKLQARAVAMIERLAAVDRSRAEAALEAAGGDIKAGVLCALGATPDEALALLEENRNILRDALAAQARGAGRETHA